METFSGETAALVAATLVQAEMAARGPMLKAQPAVIRKKVAEAYAAYYRLVASGRLQDPPSEED